jgi:hypothetical protein
MEEIEAGQAGRQGKAGRQAGRAGGQARQAGRQAGQADTGKQQAGSRISARAPQTHLKTPGTCVEDVS